MADNQEVGLTPSPVLYQLSSPPFDSLILLILDDSTTVDLRLNMYPHPLHPFDFNIHSIPSISRRSKGERICLLVLLSEKSDGGFASWWVGDFAKRARDCGFGGM